MEIFRLLYLLTYTYLLTYLLTLLVMRLVGDLIRDYMGRWLPVLVEAKPRPIRATRVPYNPVLGHLLTASRIYPLDGLLFLCHFILFQCDLD